MSAKPEQFKIGQTVYYANLRMKENGDVTKCEVRPLVIVRIVPHYQKKFLIYYAADAESRCPTPYKLSALHKLSGDALETLKNKIAARIAKLNAALGKLPQ